jgi:hypothetical protein
MFQVIMLIIGVFFWCPFWDKICDLIFGVDEEVF